MAYINGNEITFGVTLIQGSGGGGDYDQGYSAGYSAGKSDGHSEGYSDGYEQGKADGGDVIQYITSLYRMFYQVTFPDGYELNMTVKNTANSVPANDMMGFLNQAKGLESAKLSFIDQVTSVSANYAFAGSSSSGDTLKLVDISGIGCAFSTFAGAFQNRTDLQTIIGEIDLTGCTNCSNAFYNCFALENVAFVQGSISKSISFSNSSLLSDAAIQSIIDGLADLTDGTAQVLTLHATTKAKLTETQLATITQKNWSVA